MTTRKKILVLCDWFSPGFKAGGPIRSCVNFARYMKDDYDVYVFTRDRDLGGEEGYKEIAGNKWLNDENGIHLFYASPSFLHFRNILKEIKSINPDYIYLNSMFSKYFTVYPLLMKQQGRIDGKVILAPRGMLKRSAVRFKPFKKQGFLTLLRGIKVSRYITFQATDTTEVNDVKRFFGEKADVKYVPNFPGIQHEPVPVLDKEAGSLKMIFVGRVHPIKNLDFLLRLLQEVKAPVELTVAGSIEAMVYKRKCDELIQQLPSTITVSFAGDVPHHHLEEILIAHHLFCLPTQGENFGHAIFEALAVGRPVLISDQTPWRGLKEKKAGWDIALNDDAGFVTTIEAVAAMDTSELNEWCKGAWEYCHNYIEQSNIKEQYRKLFN